MRKDYRKELSVLAYPLSILSSKWLRNLSSAIKPAYRVHIKISSSTSISASGTMVVAQIKTERGRRQKKDQKTRIERQGNKKKTRRIFTAGLYGASKRREWKRWIKPEINCVIFSFHAYGYRRYTQRSVLLQSPPPPVVDPLIPFLHARSGRQSFLEGSSGLFYGVLDETWTRMVYERIRSR